MVVKGSAGIIGARANYSRRFSRIAKVGIFIGIGVFFQEKKPSISDYGYSHGDSCVFPIEFSRGNKHNDDKKDVYSSARQLFPPIFARQLFPSTL